MATGNNDKNSSPPSLKCNTVSCFLPYKALLAVGLLFLIHFSVYIHFNGCGVVLNYFPKYKATKNTSQISIFNDASIEWTNGMTDHTDSFNTTTNVPALTESKKKDKIIFYWNSYFDVADWGAGFGHKPFESCEIKNCIATNDRQKYKYSDAMLCHMRSGGCGIKELPEYRNPNQYWIYFLMESPLNSASDGSLTPYNGIFNLTLTYKQTSNITHSYSEKNKVLRELKDNSYKFYKGKMTSVAWIASNCWSSSAIQGRMTYLSKLSKHIHVKRYGRCPGHTRCGNTCHVDAAKTHKFYFAAENSICKDYVTEKPWRAIEVGMIPIVYGYGNYSQVLPPNSYINVQNFTSPRLLADYLKKVAGNETLYNEYFDWKKTYVKSEPRKSHYCKLCAFLNQENPPKSIIYNLDKFWSKANDCVNPHTFHESVIKEP